MEGNDKFHEKVKENKDFVFSCEATVPRLRRFDLDKWNQREVGILWGGPPPKSPRVVTAAMKLKDAYSLEGKL